MAIALAALFGFIAGLRTFTAPAAYFLYRGGIAGIVLAVCAVGEYVMDAQPKCPPRTRPFGMIVRLLSGGVVGWFVAGLAGSIVGAAAAIVGAYAGQALRLKAIGAFGALPAALLEDLIAIGLAILAVTRL